MKIRSLGRQIIDEVQLRTYGSLSRLAEKAVDRALALDQAATEKLNSGKIELSDWLSRQAAAARSYIYSFSEIKRVVNNAGFTSAEEAAAAIKAINGKLKFFSVGQFYSGSWPVFAGVRDAFQAEKTDYIHFLYFLSEVGKGNFFTNIDFSQSALLLFQRARSDGLIVERVKDSCFGTWFVFKDPMLFLQEKVKQLPMIYRGILCRV